MRRLAFLAALLAAGAGVVLWRTSAAVAGKERVVRGRVFDLDGRAVAGATVLAHEIGDVEDRFGWWDELLPRLARGGTPRLLADGRAGPDGAFELVLPPGLAALRATAEGRASPLQGVLVREGATSPVRLIVAPELRVRGTVVGDGGRPVADAVVVLAPDREPTLDHAWITRTDGAGRFEIPLPNLYVVDFLVVVAAAGYPATSVAVRRSAPEVVVRLERPAWFDVTVVRARTSAPVAGATVVVGVEAGPPEALCWSVGTTDDRGRARLPSCVGSVARARVREAGQHAWEPVASKDVAPADAAFEGSFPEEVTAGAHAVTLRWRDPRLVRGTVRASTGAVVAGASVRLDGHRAQTRTDASGAFSLPVPRTGDASIDVEAEGYVAQKVAVEEGRDAPLAVVLPREAVVRGRVEGPDGERTDARVAVVSRPWPEANGVPARADGGFALRGLPAARAVRVLATSDRHLPAASETFDLVEGGEVDVGVLRLRRGATLRVQVVDPGGAPVAFATGLVEFERTPAVEALLEAAWGGWPSGRRLSADEDGRFEVGGCPDGPLRVYAHHHRLAPALARVEVRGDTSVVLPLPRPVALTGVVRGAGDQPLAGAHVRVEAPFDLGWGSVFRPVRKTAADGSFAFDAMLPDVPLSVVVTAAGHRRVRSTARPPGPVELRLPPLSDAERTRLAEIERRLEGGVAGEEGDRLREERRRLLGED